MAKAPGPKLGFCARPPGKHIFERQNHTATSQVVSRPGASGTLAVSIKQSHKRHLKGITQR